MIKMSTPAKAIKAALAEALVYYYPIAGRLREVPGTNKLVVDCTGEGAVFVQASANVRLEEFGEPPLRGPYPCAEELFCDVGDTKVVVGKPLFFLQLKHLSCGGFALGFQACHNIVDAFGLIQLVKSIADLARGDARPAVLPAWERQILMARTPPRIVVLTGAGAEHKNADMLPNDVLLSTPLESMVHRHLLFGPRDIAHLRGHIAQPHLSKLVTTFELLTAVMWRCRTAALGYEAGEKARLVFPLNARGRWKRDLPIPRGYYGNALLHAVVEATVRDLCSGNPLDHTVELVRGAKADVSPERMRSMVDMMALQRGRGQTAFPTRHVYWVSNLGRIGDDAVDFGWADWVGGGFPLPKLTSFHTTGKNQDGHESVTVTLLLPGRAMDRFAKEIASWLNKHDGGNRFTPSSL
uniref:Uncharacterized protein n=1 Tax=Avena sativa TaxID=4498 RepID=A0ACD5XQ72_AVESA